MEIYCPGASLKHTSLLSRIGYQREDDLPRSEINVLVVLEARIPEIRHPEGVFRLTPRLRGYHFSVALGNCPINNPYDTKNMFSLFIWM